MASRCCPRDVGSSRRTSTQSYAANPRRSGPREGIPRLVVLTHNDVSFSKAIQERIFLMTRLTTLARGRTLAAAGGAVAIAAAATAVPAMASHPQQARAHAASATKVSTARTE